MLFLVGVLLRQIWAHCCTGFPKFDFEPFLLTWHQTGTWLLQEEHDLPGSLPQMPSVGQLGLSVVQLNLFLGEGSPSNIDCRKKGTLLLTSLLEDLGNFLFSAGLSSLRGTAQPRYLDAYKMQELLQIPLPKACGLWRKKRTTRWELVKPS